MHTLWQDVRFTARTLRRAPAFTIASLLTLALGVGATTAIFSVIDGVLLRPLPYAYGDRLVHVSQPANAGAIPDVGFSPMEVTDYESQTHAFDAIAEYHTMAFTLLGRAEPLRVQTGVVSAGFFNVLGVKPLLGRTFRSGEDQPGAAPVIVLSYEFWQRALGGDPTIVGRTFTMNDRVHTVIGVLPFLPQDPDHNDIYMPVSSCPFRVSAHVLESRTARMVTLLGRLKPGVTLAQASVDVSGVAARLHREYPDAYRAGDRLAIAAQMYRDEITRGARPTLLVLLATAAFVLLIACANVANLTLARELRREREMALRAVLGAGRRRIARQLVTESTILAVVGGALGLAVAYGLLGVLRSFTALFTPRAAEIGMDARVLAFAFAVSALTGICLGLVPALTSRRDLASGLKEDGNASTLGGTRMRLRGALISAQVSIAFMLLVGAGLMLRSFVNLERVDPGFDPANVLTARIDLDWTKYKTGPLVRNFEEAFIDRLSAGGPTSLDTLAFALPVRIVAEIVGLPAEDSLEAAVRQFVACLSPASSAEALQGAHAAALHLQNSLHALTDNEAAVTPLVRRIVEGGLEASTALPNPLVSNLLGLFSQTFDATAGLIGNSVVTLAQHGDVARRSPLLNDRMDIRCGQTAAVDNEPIAIRWAPHGKIGSSIAIVIGGYWHVTRSSPLPNQWRPGIAAGQYVPRSVGGTPDRDVGFAVAIIVGGHWNVSLDTPRLEIICTAAAAK